MEGIVNVGNGKCALCRGALFPNADYAALCKLLKAPAQLSQAWMEIAFLSSVCHDRAKQIKTLARSRERLTEKLEQAIADRNHALDKFTDLERKMTGYKSDDDEKDPDYSPPSKRAKNIRKI